MKSYMAIYNEILKCNKCGSCQDVCPTYNFSKEEAAVARGRIRLLRATLEKRFSFKKDPELLEYLQTCLMCKACEANCPSNVQITLAIEWGKKELRKEHGTSVLTKWLYQNSFSREPLLSVGTKLVRFYQKKGLKKLTLKVKNIKELEEMIPELPEKNFWELLKEHNVQSSPKKYKVIYYIGCATKYFFPNVGISTVKVLENNNCEVIVPKLPCCGAPHLGSGYYEDATKLAKENLLKLHDIKADAIVTDCGTCAYRITNSKDLFSENSQMYDIAVQVGNKVIDAIEFLTKIGIKNTTRLEKTVTYHDPCHLVRGLNVKQAPRQILNNIAIFTEMKNADSCCGGAGTYGVKYKKVSRGILAKKIHEFQKTGAEILCTSCPGCAIQLNLGLKISGLRGKVLHPLELLAETYDHSNFL